MISFVQVFRSGEDLSVRTMMGRDEFGAPATIHTRLKSMRAKGWILLSDTKDARRKQVELLQAALLHFDKLSKCILKAADATRKERSGTSPLA